MTTRNQLTWVALWCLGLLLVSAPWGAAVAATVADGPRFPTQATSYQIQGSGSANAWQQPWNIGALNNQYTFANLGLGNLPSYTQMLWGSGYNFAIPTGSTIQGILVSIYKSSTGCSTSGCIEDRSICLSGEYSNCRGDNKAQSGVAWPATNTLVTYGGATDLWGTTWSPADINSPRFGVSIAAKTFADFKNDSQARVDTVTIVVYYTPPAPAKADTATTVNCTTPITQGASSACTATVTRAAGSATPSGTVSWGGSDPSASFSGQSCSQNTGAGTLTCNVTYTPSAAGVRQVVAEFPGDANFNASHGDTTVTVKATYTISATVIGGNGSVSCSPPNPVAAGTLLAGCTAVPAAGYQVQSWGGACATWGSNNACFLTNIQANQVSTVTFVPTPPSTYSVSATVGSGVGAVSCAPANVTAGGSSQCTAVPGPGDQVAGWSGACASAGTNTQCSLTNIQANQTSTVSFSALPPASYHVSASVVGGNGSVSCTPTTVSKGESSTCTAAPDAGYQVQSWGDACAAWGSQTQCYLNKIRADQRATVSFAPIPPATYTVTATVVGGNGHVSCSPTSVTAGDASACTAVPDAGYQVQSWSGACAAAGNTAQCDLTNIQADQVSTVSFSALPVPTYSLSATVNGGNGTVSCTPSTVLQGDSGSCTATPNAGYQVASWTGACASAGTNVACALSNVQADQTSTVSFTPIPPSTYHVSASVVLGNGAVSCTPNTVTSGGNSTCTAAPDAGYQVANWGGDCAGWGVQAQCYLTKIKADQTATVSFAPLPPASYTVNATVSAGNGHVSCTPTTVTAGDSSSCTAVPDAGWTVQSWGGDCAGTGTNTLCSLTNIQANQSATVAFVAQALPSYGVSATVDGGNGRVRCAPTTVVQGDSAHCTATPDTGYQVASWSGDCAATGTNVDCFLSNIQRDQSSTVRFALLPPDHFSVTATVVSGHGAVRCTPPSVIDGGSSTCTATPDPGYRVQAWGGDCAAAGSQTQCQLSPIRANQTATVSFLHSLPGSYQVTATVDGGNGSVRCVPTTVPKGDSSTCTATPDTGYQVQAWGGDCARAGTATQCYLPKIRKDQDVTVSFAARTADTFKITALVDGGHGTVSCTPSVVSIGGDSTCTAVPDDGYQVAYWDGACLFSGQSTQCTLSNIRSDQRTTVSFTTSAQQEQVDIPTLSQWGMILLAGLLLMLAWRTGDLGLRR
jgi:hypothetical protein